MATPKKGNSRASTPMFKTDEQENEANPLAIDSQSSEGIGIDPPNDDESQIEEDDSIPDPMEDDLLHVEAEDEGGSDNMFDTDSSVEEPQNQQDVE